MQDTHLSFCAKYQQAAPKLSKGATGGVFPLLGGVVAAWAAVIHGHSVPVPPSPGQLPELPAIIRMLWYFPAEMFAIVSLWENALPTGSHTAIVFKCACE